MSRQDSPEALKRRIQALEEERDLLFNVSIDMICIVDIRTSRFLNVNPAFSDTLGHPIDAFLGQSFFDFIHPDDVKHTRRLIADDLRRGEKVIGLKTRYLCLDGTYRWLRWVARPVTAKGIALAIAHDLTEETRAEEALEASARRWQSTFDAVNDSIAVLDTDWTIRQVNKATEEILGAPVREIVGRKCYELFHGTDCPIDDCPVRETVEQIKRATERLQIGDRWYEVTADPIAPDGHTIEGIVHIVSDITARKRTESEIAHAYQRFLTVLDSIDATIFVVEIETHEILFMNKQMIDSLGGDFTGQACWRALNQEEPCADCSNDRLIDGKGHPKGAHVWQGKNPVTGKWCINHDRAIEWVDGRMARLQVATDISELKRLETQLQQSQKMEAIGTLAGGIAHDFNNILSAIIGYAELSLDEAAKGSDLSRNLVEIHTAAMRARDLVSQILTFARQANQDLKPLKVSLIANEVMKLLRSTLPATIEIRYAFDTKRLVMADPTQIHQIFMNLCTNAAHAMEMEGGRLDVFVTDHTFSPSDLNRPRSIEPGEYLKITISDTGNGIAEEIQPFIFEPYFTTKPAGEGTGLGLSVVHGIVRGCGGDIQVKSNTGRGTIFTIYLPAIQSRIPDRRPDECDIETGNERILFIDDEEAIADMSGQILERMGYKVTSLTSSKDAMDLFRSSPHDFDLVITDMTMPQMTGARLAEEMIKIRPDLPVIICTGYSKRLTDEQVTALGIKAVAMKPIAKEDLSRTVRKVLDEAKAERQ